MADRKDGRSQEPKSFLGLPAQDARVSPERPKETSVKATENTRKRRKQKQKNNKGSSMASPEQEGHYTKASGFATTHGQKFEINSAGLLYLRGINSRGLQFELATNVEGAGSLDDIVFRFLTLTEPCTWITMYVQLKHKETIKVTQKLLKGCDNDKSFFLRKYLDAYLEIEKAMKLDKRKRLFNGNFEDCLFIIFTNANAGENLGNPSIEPLSQGEAFVWSGTGSVYIFKGESHPAILECLGECGDNGPKFLSRLRLFCGQLNAKELESAVQDELEKVSDEVIRGVDIEKLRVCFLAKVEDWWENSTEILTNDGNLLLRAVDKLCFESDSEKTLSANTLAVDFKDIGNLKLVGDTSVPSIVIVVCEESKEDASFKLSLTKLMQAIEGKALVLDCEHLLAHKDALRLRWPENDYSSLVICANDWSEKLSKEFLEVVKHMVAIRQEQEDKTRKCYSLIFLFNESIFRKLSAEFKEGTKRYDDEFKFSQLQPGSQEKILATNVNLQGYKCTLSDFLSDPGETGDDRKIADIVVNAESVLEAIENTKTLPLGPSWGKEIDHYVERTLEQASVVKDSVFQEGALQETVSIVITAKQNKSSELSRTSKTSYPTFVRNTINYLTSLQYFESNERTELLIRRLSESLPISDNGDDVVDAEKSFRLGSYTCSCVRFRSATALLVTLAKTNSQQARFLFLPEEVVEEDATKLSGYYKSQHFLSLREGKLHWIRSLGKVEVLRPHIDVDHLVQSTPANATDVEGRLMLVCAEPGMGKSTLLTWLANKTKEAYECYFIVSISLSDHVELFKNGRQKDAVGFILSAMKISSPLQRSLLKYALAVTGKVVVLLDGLDEIAPKHVGHCFELLSGILQTTKAEKIWMTSRNLCRNEIESRFSMFAIQLREFDENDMRAYLTNFWKTPTDRLNKFIDELLEKTSQSVRDNRNSFIGVPLQIKMLAEVYDDQVKISTASLKLPEVLDLYVLLEEFIDKKCSVYLSDKFKWAPGYEVPDELRETTKDGLIEKYSKVALVLIFGNDDIKRLLNESFVAESSNFLIKVQRENDKAGFIDDVVNGKPRFIHRVFAEYFAAKWISDHLAESIELIKSKMFTAECTVVRNIFDRILVAQGALHTAVLDENFEQVQNLLENNERTSLLEEKDGGERTALHLAAGFGTSENREVNIRRTKIVELLIKTTIDLNHVDKVLKVSPLQYADITNSWTSIDRFLLHMKQNKIPLNKELLAITLQDVTHPGMLETIFDLDLNGLMGFCLDNGLAVEYCTAGKRRLLIRACQKGSYKVSEVLIEKNANISFDDGNIENGNDTTPLFTASELGHEKIVTQLCSKYIAMQKCDKEGKEDVENLRVAAEYVNFKVKGEENSTAVHAAAVKGHTEVIRVLLRYGGDPLSRDTNNRTPLHNAAKYNQPEALKILLSSLNEAEQAAAVYSCDKLDRSVMMYSALAGCLESVKILVNVSAKLSLNEVPNEEIESQNKTTYIALTDYNNMNAVQLAADKGHTEIIRFLISEGGDPQSSTEMEMTALHHALLNGHHASVVALFEPLDEANRKYEANRSDFWGDNALIFAVMGGCLDSVKLMVEAGAKISYLSGTGRSPLNTAAECGYSEIVECLLQKFCEQRKGMELTYNLAENQDFLKAIQVAAQFGYLDVIKDLISQDDDPLRRKRIISKAIHIAAANKRSGDVANLLSVVDEDDRANLVNSCSKDGKTLLHSALLGGCLKCVDLLLQAGGKLAQPDTDGRTVLMAAAESGLQEIVSYLLTKFDENKEENRKKDYINITNAFGRSAIHIAALKGHSHVVRILVDQGGDAKSLDSEGSTPLHLAAQFKNAGAMEVLLAVLAETDRPDAVNARDHAGDSVLHCAILGGCLECIDLVIHAGGKLSQRNLAGCSPLMGAAEGGDKKVVERLLDNFDETKEDKNKLDFINMGDENGLTAIHRAARNGRSDVISVLICHGGEPLALANDNSTPLHLAAGLGEFQAVEILIATLEAAADRISAVNLCDKDGKNVLHYATLGGCLDCVKHVVEVYGKDANKKDFINLADNDGNTALHYTATNRKPEVIRFLISEGGERFRRNKQDSTPLHWAATNLSSKNVKILLHALPNEVQAEVVNALNADGDSALICGIKGGCEKCVKHLVTAGGSLSQAPNTGNTPLMTAAARGNSKIVKILMNIVKKDKTIKPKQYVNLKDNYGFTAMHHATQNIHSSVIKVLINEGSRPFSLDLKKRSPLHLAAGTTPSCALEALLEKVNKKNQADFINSRDDDGNSVLMHAAMGGNVDCVEHLLKAGGKLSVANNDRRTPLMAASAFNHGCVIKFILENFDPVKENMELLEYIYLFDKDNKAAFDLADTEGRDLIGPRLVSCARTKVDSDYVDELYG